MDIDDIDRIRKQIHSITVDEDGFFWVDKGQEKKKQPLLSIFLAKIDEPLLIEMQQYLKKAKPNFKKNKIQLYEDISWIVRFKREEDRIKFNKLGVITSIAKDLEKQFHRSAKTIRQRVQKFLSKIEPEDIKKHLRLGADFTFDSKRILIDTKYQIKQETKSVKQQRERADLSSQTEVEQTFQLPQGEHSYTRFKQNNDLNSQFAEVKQEMPSASVHKIESSCVSKGHTSKSGVMKIKARNQIIPNQQDIDQRSSIRWKQSVRQPAQPSVYKYGSKPVKEPIYICYSFIENNFFCVSETFLKQKTPQFFNGQRDLQTKIDNDHKRQSSPQQKVKREVEVIEIPEDESESDQGQALTHSNRMASTEQMKREYEQAKRRLSSIMRKLQSDPKQSQKHIASTRFLASPKRSPSIKEEISENITESIGREKIEHNAKEQEHDSQMCKRESEEQSKLIYQLSNNLQHLDLIQVRPNLKSRYIWSSEEDKILELFSSGNPEAFKQYLTCLMRYKDLETIRERCLFLRIQLNQQCQHILQQLWHKVKDRY